MKQTTKMSRAVGQLEKMYSHINADFFNGELPTPIITVQSKPGTYGHCSVAKVWKKKDGETYELNIAAEVLSYPIEETLDTMIHEMVHLYCRENNIQEVSRGGTYHNGRFKAEAEKRGLECYKTEKYGWNTRPSAELSEKIHRGQKDNALKGLSNGGSVPFGYQINNSEKRLEINPNTAAIVREIFQRYAAGDSIRIIRDDLNTRGIKTNRGYPFRYSTFSTILKNRKYIGEYKYADVLIPNGIPAIVSEQVFNRVQKRMEKNRQTPAAAKAPERYILTTKIFCGECGKMMAGESGHNHGKIYRYYKCSGAKQGSGCSKKPIKKK